MCTEQALADKLAWLAAGRGLCRGTTIPSVSRHAVSSPSSTPGRGEHTVGTGVAFVARISFLVHEHMPDNDGA